MRHCLVEPIGEIFTAAQKLQQAVIAHLNGNSELAEQLFREADDPMVWQFTDIAWGKGCKQRYGLTIDLAGRPLLKLVDRPRPRMPTAATKAAVLARDGYHCRFCGMPVVSSTIRQLAHRLYPTAVKWGRTNAEQHAAFQCMWLQFDHVLPNARGGDSSTENVVVTCAPCNFGRMETTLEEAGLVDPRGQQRTDTWAGYQTWSGLQSLAASAQRGS